jgi:four helix bundle protein
MQDGTAQKNKIKQFTDLYAWQEGHKLVVEIYQATNSFPSEEKFSLTSQIRRAAVSVTSNLAEGFGRQGQNEKLQFYGFSRGSLLELQDQLIIARDIKILPESRYVELSEQAVVVHKLVNGLMRSIQRGA